MNAEAQPDLSLANSTPASVAARRFFLHEPGWRVALKVDSVRTFCYQMAPGQDYYHRLLDGEIYLHHGDERLCMACATRRGLISYEAKGLRPREFDSELESEIANETIGPEGEIELKDGEEGNRFL